MQLYNERVVEVTTELYWQTVMGYLAQMYTSCLYAYGQISCTDRMEAKHILKQYAYLLHHSLSIKSGRVIKIKRMIGLSATIGLFALYGKIKQKIKTCIL